MPTRYLFPVLALSVLMLAGCGGSSDKTCADVTCGDNARCEEGTVTCVCNPGYIGDPTAGCTLDTSCNTNSCNGHGTCNDSSGTIVCTCEAEYTGETCADCAANYFDDNGICINSRQVPCTDVAPANATSTVVDVTVTYTDAGGWTTPTQCEWTCDADYDLLEGACVNSRMVPCVDDPPSNASSIIADVEITFTDAGGWSTPADCEFECNPDFDNIGGACLNSRVVPCVDVAPAHATSTVVDHEITYTDAGGWTAAPDCGWSCDPDYDEQGGACINSRMVPCVDNPPANATSIPGDVEITYTDAGGWTPPADCPFDCDPDYADVDGACINTQTVPCVDVAPANATSTVTNHQITYTDAGGWTTAPDCEWNCDPDYDDVGGACINSQMVACVDNPPPNSTSIPGNVEITYTDAGGWTTPADCAYACDPDYDDMYGTCINHQMVLCNDVAPANATSTMVEHEITYTDAGGWTSPPDCEWSCDPDYDEQGGACLNSQMVPCVDNPPANATSILEDVEITYTDAGGWTLPADCAWECEYGYHPVGDVCEVSILIEWCNLQWPPDFNGHTGENELYFGQVYTPGTEQPGQMAGILSRFCYSDQPIGAPVDIESLTCVDADFNVDVGNNDEYMLDAFFEEAGVYEYIYAFSGTDGYDWVTCDLDGVTGDTVNPGVATVTNRTEIHETFDTGFPRFWIFVDWYVDMLTWEWCDPDGGCAHPNNTGSTSGSGFALVDSDAAGYDPCLFEEIYLPPVDLSGMTTATLSYFHSFVTSGSEEGKVDISIDGGNGWINMDNHTADDTSERVIDLSWATGQPDVRVRFIYDDYCMWGYHWQIDDIHLWGN